MIKAIFFDLDGTLLNSLKVWEKVDECFLHRRNIEVPRDYQEALLHLRFFEAAEYTIERFKLNETKEAIMDEWMMEAKRFYQEEVSLKKGAKEFIQWLKEKNYQLGIITSCHQELFEPCLKKHGIWEYFDCIVEANQVHLSKKEKEIYQYALKQVGLKGEECLFFDDVTSSIQAASSVKMNTIAVCDPHSYDEQVKEWTLYEIEDFSNLSDLEAIIKKMNA